jgi:transcriptional regulator with XRE-family HTH domain
MKREELLRSPHYWLAHIQNDLYGMMQRYMAKNKLRKKDLADKLGFTKGYISQVMNGDFNHKISKLVELALACDTVPVVHFLPADKYIADDADNKIYEVYPVIRPQEMTFERKTDVVKVGNSLTTQVGATIYYMSPDEKYSMESVMIK